MINLELNKLLSAVNNITRFEIWKEISPSSQKKILKGFESRLLLNHRIKQKEERTQELSDKLKYGQILSQIDSDFHGDTYFERAYFNGVGQPSNEDILNFLRYFTEIKEKMLYDANLPRKLINMLKERIDLLNIRDSSVLVNLFVRLRYYDREMYDQICKAILDKKSSDSIALSLIACNMCTLDQRESTIACLDQLKKTNFISKAHYFVLLRVLYSIVKMKLYTNTDIISKILDNLNAFQISYPNVMEKHHERNLVMNIMLLERECPSVLKPEYLLWKEKAYKNDITQNYYEKTTRLLLDEYYGCQSIPNYSLGAFEYDLYYPTIDTIIEIFGPGHF